MAIKFSNYASSLLTAAIAAGDTSASVVSAATFPTLSAGDYFYAVLTDANDATHEIVKVTAISSLTFTIARAQDGTSAQAWPSGTKSRCDGTPQQWQTWTRRARTLQEWRRSRR